MKFFLLCATCAYLFFTLALCEDLSQYERLKKSLAAEIAFGKIDYLPPYSEPLSNPVKKQKDFFKLLVLDNEVDLVKGITVHAYKLLFSRYHYPESIFTFAIKEDKLEIFKILIEAVKPEHYEYIDVGFIVVEHGIFSVADVEATFDNFDDFDVPANFIAAKFDYELVNIDTLIEIQADENINENDSRILMKSVSFPKKFVTPYAIRICQMELPMVNYYKYLSLSSLWHYESPKQVIVDLTVPEILSSRNTILFREEYGMCTEAHKEFVRGDARTDLENYLNLYAKPDDSIFASAVFAGIVGTRFGYFYPVFKKYFTNLRAKDLMFLKTGQKSIGVAFKYEKMPWDVIDTLLRDFPDSHHIMLRLFYISWQTYEDDELTPYLYLFFKHFDRNDPKLKHFLKLTLSFIFHYGRFNLIYEIISAGYVPLDLTIRNNLNIAQLLVSFQAKDVVLKLEKSDLKEEFRKALLIDYGFNADALRTSICSNSKFSPVVLKLLIDLVPEELTRLDIKEETIEQTCHNNSNIYKHLVGQKKKRGLQVFSARSYKERNHFLERTFPNIKRPNTPKGTQKQKILSYGSFNFERNVALENGQIVDHLYQLIKEGKEDLVKYYKTIYTNRSLLSPKIPKSYLSLAVEHGNLNIVKSLIEIHEMEDFFSFFLSSKELPNHLVYQIIELKRIEILNYLMDRGVIKEEILFACLQTFKDRQKVDEFLKEVQSVALSLLEYMSSVESELFFDKMSSILLDTLNSKKLLLPVEPQLVIEDSKEELDLNDPTINGKIESAFVFLY
ncbi:hypothetical protein O9G_004406 [Rozella allomycis CSF55]|uniref:Ankyrin n=1 Tax=Rozella allomycis (strain CSF55) TaxID=988480 RepID=A0A075AQJ9_ROZAC|nr:hypothetical protein O9G_004406 [Rozella allomycis CSF55]|eukprot:EPZ32498.1 hypothetical protein O9G_004406 [Rozella allomycis CSF55]